MPDQTRLENLLHRLDGRSYPAYRDLRGTWRLGGMTLVVDHVQGDPFAAPSRLRLRVDAGLPGLDDRDRREATEDWLLRRFGAVLRGEQRGSGRSGQLRVYRPGPEVVERSAVRLFPDGTAEVRFTAGLPAGGRRILGRQARAMLTADIPRAARAIQPAPGLEEHARSVVVQRSLRRQLRSRGLAAFVADGSILPRASGVDQRPLADAVPFTSPPSLRVALDTPEGEVVGMGVPEGVTLIAGGGFHGKSTLLQAIQRGHLDHVPGDGRERVVARPETVKVRAEDGRRVVGVDISPFLRDLPGGRSTRPFHTEDASGSTSQAAAIVEAVEAGARVLLMDEDTCATNLMVRDERMRRLVPRDREPITPLVERVRAMRDQWGVSSILVIGGVGDYLGVADLVLVMEDYRPREATAEARSLVPEPVEADEPLGPVEARVIHRRGLRPGKIRARDTRSLRYADQDVDLAAVEQLLDTAQTITVGEAIRLLHDEIVDDRRDMRQVLAALEAILDDEGVEALAPRAHPPGDLVRPRRHEVAAALCRLRSLQVG